MKYQLGIGQSQEPHVVRIFGKGAQAGAEPRAQGQLDGIAVLIARRRPFQGGDDSAHLRVATAERQKNNGNPYCRQREQKGQEAKLAHADHQRRHDHRHGHEQAIRPNNRDRSHAQQPGRANFYVRHSGRHQS